MDDLSNLEEEDNFFISEDLKNKLDLSDLDINIPEENIFIKLTLNQDIEIFGKLNKLQFTDKILNISVFIEKKELSIILNKQILAITIQKDEEYVYSQPIINQNYYKEIENLKDNILLNLKLEV